MIAMSIMNITNKVSVDTLSKISHDFKTPINVILSSSTLLRLRLDPTNEEYAGLFQYLHYIEQNGHRLLRLVNTLLDDPNPGSASPRLYTSQCDLDSFLRHTLNDLKLIASQKNIELHYDPLPKGPCSFNFDRDHLERILTNLVANAIRYTPSGGMILVSADTDDDFVQIRITDTGNGIDSDLLPQLFEPHFTNPDGSRDLFSGTGLGLSIVKELVELHRGTISVTSSPEKGSCVTFTLSRHLPHTMSTPE